MYIVGERSLYGRREKDDSGNGEELPCGTPRQLRDVVAYGYARATGKPESEAVASAEMFRAFGGGKAPDGQCGALYAAKMMQPDHADAIEEFFKRGAQGFTKCREIRPAAVIPCNRCVELAGEALDFLNQ